MFCQKRLFLNSKLARKTRNAKCQTHVKMKWVESFLVYPIPLAFQCGLDAAPKWVETALEHFMSRSTDETEQPHLKGSANTPLVSFSKNKIAQRNGLASMTIDHPGLGERSTHLFADCWEWRIRRAQGNGAKK